MQDRYATIWLGLIRRPHRSDASPSNSSAAQKIRDSAVCQRLRLIAGRWPIAGSLEPVPGSARFPPEGGVYWNLLEHRAEIGDVIGGEAELCAALHGAREVLERAGRHYAPLVVPRFRPGIRKQDEYPPEASVRQGR